MRQPAKRKKPSRKAGRASRREHARLPRANVDIDLDGFEARAVVLPPKSGNYANLQAVKGKLLYRRLPRTGSSDEKSPIVFFDFQEREEKTILDEADAFEVTFDGKKLFVAQQEEVRDRRDQAGAEVREADEPPPTSRCRSIRAPSGGRCSSTRTASSATSSTTRTCTASTGPGCATRYGKLLDDAVTRWDVNFVLGEFIGELNASHTYRGGGDEEQAPKRSVGHARRRLGARQRRLPDQAHRRAAGRGTPRVRSPLDEPGVNVKEGDYVLAVNGVPLEHRRPIRGRASRGSATRRSC